MYYIRVDKRQGGRKEKSEVKSQMRNRTSTSVRKDFYDWKDYIGTDYKQRPIHWPLWHWRAPENKTCQTLDSETF